MQHVVLWGTIQYQDVVLPEQHFQLSKKLDPDTVLCLEWESHTSRATSYIPRALDGHL